MNKRKGLLLILFGIMLLTLSAGQLIAQDPYDYYDDYYGTEWALFGLGLFCIIPIIWFIIAILICIWVYRDAEKRGSSGILWLIIVLITGIIGLIIWLIVRPPIGSGTKSEPQMPDRRCPECGRTIPEDAKVCPYCGRKFGE